MFIELEGGLICPDFFLMSFSLTASLGSVLVTLGYMLECGITLKPGPGFLFVSAYCKLVKRNPGVVVFSRSVAAVPLFFLF